MVAPRVYEAMSKPIVGYLDPYCFQVIEEIQDELRKVFGTRNEITFPISGTGSAGMETAVANFAEPGEKCAVFVNGFFSERICEMARRQGAQVVRLEKPWGEVFSDAEARAASAILVPGPETSGGLLQGPQVSPHRTHFDALRRARRPGSDRGRRP